MKTKEIKEKTINFRSFFVAALFLIAVVFSALITINILWLGALCFALIILCSVVFAFISFKKFRYDKSQKFKLITFALCAVLAIFSYSLFIITAKTWADTFSGEAKIIGTVESDRAVNNQRQIYLTHVKINGISVKGRLVISVGDSANSLQNGTVISCNAAVNDYQIVDGFSVNGYAFRNNLRYRAELECITQDMVAGKNTPSIVVKIKEAIYGKLAKAMDEEYAGLAFGMLTGDKAFIDNDVKDYFSAAGLMHILAVSGLHLSIIAMFLLWILNKLGINRKINALILTLFLVFYAFLAELSPSVVRAAIMSLVGLYVYLFGTRRDLLSSLSFAFCLIITFAPVFMFEAGFVLSFCCVYSIALFAPTLLKWLKKIKCPRFLAQAISLSIAIQIGIFPACVYYFNSFQPYAFFVNILLMPIITATFTAIFVCLIFAFTTTLLLPLKISGYGIIFIDLIADTVSQLPLARVVVYSSALIFACYALFFIMSKFVMLRKKWISTSLCVILCAMLVVIQNPVVVNTYSIAPLQYAYSNVSFVSTQNGNYVVGDFWSGGAIKGAVKQLMARKVDAVFINKINDNIAEHLINFNRFFTIPVVYCPFDKNTAIFAALLLDYGININLFELNENQNYIAFSDGFCAYFEKEKFYAYGLNAGNANILFVPFGKNYNNFSRISEFNIIRTNSYYGGESQNSAVYLINDALSDNPFIVSSSKYPNYIFNYKTGKIYSPKRL